MSEKKRRKWTAEEKLRIVLTGMDGGGGLRRCVVGRGSTRRCTTAGRSSCCASAGQIFERSRRSRGKEGAIGGGALARMKDVIAEITAENLELKKTLSG